MKLKYVQALIKGSEYIIQEKHPMSDADYRALIFGKKGNHHCGIVPLREGEPLTLLYGKGTSEVGDMIAQIEEVLGLREILEDNNISYTEIPSRTGAIARVRDLMSNTADSLAKRMERTP